jgi:hypothetical protein
MMHLLSRLSSSSRVALLEFKGQRNTIQIPLDQSIEKMPDDSAENRMLDGPNHLGIKRQYWISQTKINNERYVFVTVRILAQKCTAGLYEKLAKTDKNDKSLCSLRTRPSAFFAVDLGEGLFF